MRKSFGSRFIFSGWCILTTGELRLRLTHRAIAKGDRGIPSLLPRGLPVVDTVDHVPNPPEDTITVDRRGGKERRSNAQSAGAPPGGVERRKVQRRRQIDPTTCERDYSAEEIEFMRAMDEYKRKHGRMFPTCSEILEVVRALGYVKMPAEKPETLSAEAGLTENSVETRSNDN